MSKKEDLRKQRIGTVINATSKQQESSMVKALDLVFRDVSEGLGVRLVHETEWKLVDVVRRLSESFPDVPFHHHFDNTAMRPDGGILSILSKDGERHAILIAEVKNQGTNDARAREGLKKQARGNAIERLGKNVIGFRTALLAESIMPFVCFGYGCDFEEVSSILDRVTTIAMFGPLNEISVVNLGEGGVFNRGSFFFREEEWTVDEMVEVMSEVARRAIHYYFAKYGEEHFRRD